MEGDGPSTGPGQGRPPVPPPTASQDWVRAGRCLRHSGTQTSVWALKRVWPSGQKQPSASAVLSGLWVLGGGGSPGPAPCGRAVHGAGSGRGWGWSAALTSRGPGWGKGTPEPCPHPRRLPGPRQSGRAHLESQDAGCTGPHGLYTFLGGQGSSGGRDGCQVGRGSQAPPTPRSRPQLTAQPARGVSPVAAHAPGTAERRVGLQALAGHPGVAGLAGVLDAGAEEQAGRDEVVALGEDAAGRGGAVRGGSRAGSGPDGGHCPGVTTPSGGTHWLSISSQRGAGGHGVEVGVVGAGEGGLVVAGGPVGAQQPSLLVSGTSQALAMSRQVGAMVPSGRRQSSVWLLVQVPGGGAGGSWRGRPPPPPPPPWGHMVMKPG